MMIAAELTALKPILAAYNVTLETDGTQITKVNAHEAQLDAVDYMSDQLIKVILEIIGADVRAALFKKNARLM